ncbi:MAG: 30S ribosomal protein S6--L-glutamate ligase [Burkholderiaceae bacterium]
MKFALLARVHRLYSHQRLKQAAIERGHEFDMIDTLGCYLSLRDGRADVHALGQPPSHYDAVIPRIGASALTYGLAVVRQFQAEGVTVLNRSGGIAAAGDKLHSMQKLAREGVDMPLTTFAQDPNQAQAVLDTVGGAPVIIKLLEGSLGMGVILAETNATAISIIRAFRGANVNILVQQFVAESAGTDIRALVVGDEVVAAMKRTGLKGEFRSNLHRGGSAESVDLSAEETAAAIRAARTIGLRVGGVDMLRSNRGPVVLEVNATPGIEGIEKATGIDVAGKIIELLAVQTTIEKAQREQSNA